MIGQADYYEQCSSKAAMIDNDLDVISLEHSLNMQRQLRALILKNIRLLKATWIGSLIFLVILPAAIVLSVYVTYNRVIKDDKKALSKRDVQDLLRDYNFERDHYYMYDTIMDWCYLDRTVNNTAKSFWAHAKAIYERPVNTKDGKISKQKIAATRAQYFTDAKELDSYLYREPSADTDGKWQRRVAIEYINDTAYTLMFKTPDMRKGYASDLAQRKFRDLLSHIFGHIQFDELQSKKAYEYASMESLIDPYNYCSFWLEPARINLVKLVYGMYVLMLSIALLLVFVSATSSLLKEKKDRVLILTRLNGMKLSPYLMSHFIFYYVIALFPALCVIILGFAFSFPLFKFPLLPILVILTSGLSAVTFSMLAAVFLPANRVATMITLAWTFISNIGAAMVFAFGVDHVAFYLVPFYSTTHLLAQSAYYGYLSVECSEWLKDDKIGGLMLHLLQPFVYYLLAVYFFQVCNQKGTGVSRPWLFPLYSLVKWVNKNVFKDDPAKAGKQAPSSQDMLVPDSAAMDDDVKREAHNAYDMKNKNNPLILKNVMLTYPDGKSAVNGVSLTVENGIVFGLLGPNGAGKTSLINIMAGVHKHTSGEVLIANYDIRQEPQKVYENIGYCPQHDIYWSKLNVENHIQLFLQLKGTCKNREEEKAKLEDLLNLVNLQKQRHQVASSLSGGEKRRLSLALAFCGNARVIFLDEPTTGLDPEVRTMIWKIIEDAKQGRLLILTTHSMEEAEKLSDKIVIMAQGALKCFGSPQYLKNKFGGKIVINVSSSKESLATALKSIVSLYPDQMKIHSQSGSIGKIQFSGDKTEIPIIYEKIEELIHSSMKAAQSVIYDWGFDQPSLAEVFLSIVSETEAAA